MKRREENDAQVLTKVQYCSSTRKEKKCLLSITEKVFSKHQFEIQLYCPSDVHGTFLQIFISDKKIKKKKETLAPAWFKMSSFSRDKG